VNIALRFGLLWFTWAVAFSINEPEFWRLFALVFGDLWLALLDHFRFLPRWIANKRPRYWEQLEKSGWALIAFSPWLALLFFTDPAFGPAAATLIGLAAAYRILPSYLRWHVSPPEDGRITLRRAFQTVIIDAANFATLEYGLFGARAVLHDGRRLRLADDESAAILIGVAYA